VSPSLASDSVEAMALALVNRYVGHLPLGALEEQLARAAYLEGFRRGYSRGGRNALESCTDLATALADRSFRTALATLVGFIDAQVTP
jgi:hypothetical protein